MTISEILEERKITHGNFCDNSTLSQRFKDNARKSENWNNLPYFMRESLDMTLHKISRILSGDFMEIDHWRDIVGYTQLVINEINGKGNNYDK